MNKLIICLFSLFLFIGCGDDELPSPEIQIAEFIESEGLDVSTTDSGLRFVFQEEGTGDLPVTNSIIEFTFIAKLYDGTIVNESNTPVDTYLTGVINGLEEGFRMILLKEFLLIVLLFTKLK